MKNKTEINNSHSVGIILVEEKIFISLYFWLRHLKYMLYPLKLLLLFPQIF